MGGGPGEGVGEQGGQLALAEQGVRSGRVREGRDKRRREGGREGRKGGRERRRDGREGGRERGMP